MPFVIIQPIQVRSRKRRRALNDAWTVDGLRTPGVSEWGKIGARLSQHIFMLTT